IYNPLTDVQIHRGEDWDLLLRGLFAGQYIIAEMSGDVQQILYQHGWLVQAEQAALAQRFYLKYVSLEATTGCNQACYFCPVSVAPRGNGVMSLEDYQRIVGQLAVYRHTIRAVFMNNYNEPTADPHFLERVQILKSYELTPALLTNGTGLTPKVIDALNAMGGLPFLTVNLSTIDRDRYRQERGRDHLLQVLRNLDYLREHPVGEMMNIVVLGKNDDRHQRDYEEICERFARSNFMVKFARTNDRSSYLNVGQAQEQPHQFLKGCDQTGSRPLQHLHINATGTCVLCCQDYNEDYVIGNLMEQTVEEVLTGPAIALLRRWVYGIEDAPDDFICRKCIFARIP
ncbi:MAG: hypothetical protein CUN54_08925, partial [Phototrophicales bacterium]